ncbi:PH domain-containing protein [Flavobacterium agrisoli]|uniref:PH domain-containing protein n=1 Tax=Flavobacterium agrisoli TaxID=2793066 RepID=A0A934UJT8_9FLAO|nr:PH domain-containing protein [Flavobacterium agrisoli]MBK0369899.1 PH domain-containing protein [Flavobacterium agrisoli]
MKVYKSKIGMELVIPISVLFSWIIYTSVMEKKWMALLIIILTSAFICYTFLSTKYTIEKENLNIKCGFFVSKNIEIKTIRKISETHNILSSPAGSIDRLEIVYNKFDSILISPKDKKRFLEDLKIINPELEINYRKNK